MPVYKRKDRPGYRITVWTPEGQREWSVPGTLKDAKLFERQKQHEVSARQAKGTRTVPTFAAFCIDAYEPHARVHLRKSTWGSKRIFVASLVEHFGATRLDAIHVSQVEKYKAGMIGDGLQNSSINNYLKALKTILRFADEGYGYPVAKLKFKMLKERRGNVRFWTSDEVARLYAALALESPHLLPVVRFLLNTGCRKGEAIAAEWSWLDFDRAIMEIPVNKVWQPKSGKPRHVTIDGLVPMLRAMPRKGPHVFTSPLGHPYLGFPSQTFVKSVRLAGLKGSTHTTRHTFASHFLRARPDLRLLADILGHSHLRVTELYAHMLPGHLEQARGAVSLDPPESLAATLATPPKTEKTS